MKKLTACLLAMILIFSTAACGVKKPAETGTVRLGGLKGPTTMGMVKLLDDAENGLTQNTYEFQMAVAADELTPLLLKGELDIISVPANLASVLYNNSQGKVKVLAINTLGVIYILEKGSSDIKSVTDLRGRTIYATGKGTTPEYALSYILSANGLDIEKDVTMEWKSEPTEVVATISKMDNAVAMMPQPFVTVASNQISDLGIALSLTEEWDKTATDGRFITSVLVANADFVAANEGVVATFLEEYKASSDFANSDVEKAAELIEKYDIVKAPIAKKALPYCSLTCITGDDMVNGMKGYLSVLFEREPKSVGGKLPDEDLYYIVKTK